MWIADLKIENFRGIKSGKIHFSNHSIIIGPNNSGKTTIIEALALLFGRDKMIRTLTEHDFYGSDPKPKDRINLLATIVGFPSQKPEDNDWFGEGRAVPKWYDSKTNQLLPTPNNDAKLLACQIAFSARFDKTTLEVETLRYFYDGDGEFEDVFMDDSCIPLSRRFTSELGFFLVPANRSWDKIISFGSELFRRLIASGGGQPADSVLAARDDLRNPSNPLEADPNLSKLVEDINSEFKEFFLSAPQLKFRITHTDSDGVLESVIPHFTHGDIPQIIPSRRHGNGLISLQWLLLLLQFGKIRASSSENFIMAIEEPELHIPPHTQQKLVHRLQAVSNQAISTTHSPTVASITDPTDILVIHNFNGNLVCKKLLEKPLDNSASNAIRNLFQISRSHTISALMHEMVLIPEGRIDFELIRLLTKAVDLRKGWINNGNNDFGITIGLVPTHNSAVVETYKLFSGLHSKVCCIVDGDKAGQDYIKTLLPISSSNTKILTWPKDWSIEDVIGWILSAGEAEVLSILSTSFRPFSDISELISLLKTDTKTNGYKGDYLAYEHIANAIYQIKECNKRSQDLLNNITAVISGQPSKLFKQQQSPNEKVYVFTP